MTERIPTEQAWTYLRKQEWSMGNGQCPACHARGPSWLGFGGWGLVIGHKKDCGIAASLVALGQPVVWEHQYKRIPRGEYSADFGKVDWEAPETQALLQAIRKSHPEMIRQ